MIDTKNYKFKNVSNGLYNRSLDNIKDYLTVNNTAPHIIDLMEKNLSMIFNPLMKDLKNNNINVYIRPRSTDPVASFYINNQLKLLLSPKLLKNLNNNYESITTAQIPIVVGEIREGFRSLLQYYKVNTINVYTLITPIITSSFNLTTNTSENYITLYTPLRIKII